MSEVLITIRVEPLEEGGYLATSDDLQGLVAQGRTVAETMEIAQDVARKLIESCVEHGDPLPPKVSAALRRQRRTARQKAVTKSGIIPKPIAEPPCLIIQAHCHEGRCEPSFGRQG